MRAESLELMIEYVTGEARGALHTMLGMAELIADHPLDASQRQYLDVCRTGADKLLGLIDEVSKIVAPGGNLSSNEVFSVDDMLGAIKDVLDAVTPSDRPSLRITVDPDVTRCVVGDRAGLESVLTRILLAANDSTGLHISVIPGRNQLGFDIAFKGDDSPTRLLADLDPESLMETVSIDTQQRVSLTIAGMVIRQMGGRVERRDDGRVLRITVTLSPGAEIVDDPQPINVVRFIAPMDILVAEDCESNYALVVAYLANSGHRIGRAVDGAEALKLAISRHYDLILMDVHMPGLDGYSATREIRIWETRNCRPRTPIVVVSGDDLPRQIHLGAMAGCSGYLMKPVSRSELLDTIQRYAV